MNSSCLESIKCEEHKTKKRSLVWKFFEKISMQRVQCRLCKHEQNYQGTTGNILRHLKSRHALDITIKGQQDPENQSHIRKLMDEVSSSTTSTINAEKEPFIIRKTSITSDSSEQVDPYNDNDSKQMVVYDLNSLENGNMFYENFAELQEECMYNNEKKEMERKSARRTKIDEDRTLAETEYYREKAAYFRILKHLTALQAKKIKLEIEEIVLNKKN